MHGTRWSPATIIAAAKSHTVCSAEPVNRNDASFPTDDPSTKEAERGIHSEDVERGEGGGRQKNADNQTDTLAETD